VIIDPWGSVLASASTGEAVVTARLDPGLRDALGRRLPVARHQRIYVPDPE
jgi:predicted amidohydrolase